MCACRCADAAERRRSDVSASRSIVWLSIAPLLNTATTSGVAADETDDLHRSHGGQLGSGTDDYGGVLRDLGEQVGGLVQQLFEATVSGVEESADPLRRGRIEPARGGDVVDEEPVALVGRDAAGGRVRLGEIALLLEDRHLVAHGRRTDPHAREVGDVRRAHRLRGGDVLLHDGPENGGLAFVEHLAVQVSEC